MFYYFKLNNEKFIEQQFAEFIVDNDKNKIAYKSLVYGDYDLFFVEGSESLLYKIILDNDCDSNAPFKCFANETIQCVISQTDSDCPTGYTKCDYMHYCVLENRTDMCFIRYSKVPAVNKRVYPIGKVLCADLSCRDNYTDYLFYEYCRSNYRCPYQSCHRNIKKCITINTCEKSTNYMCNNEKCVESEL